MLCGKKGDYTIIHPNDHVNMAQSTNDVIPTAGKLTVLDPVAKAQEYADILRYKEKCDLVVLISHLGWDEGTLSDQYVIANTRGIDLVLGGHSHTYFETLRYVRNLVSDFSEPLFVLEVPVIADVIR